MVAHRGARAARGGNLFGVVIERVDDGGVESAARRALAAASSLGRETPGRARQYTPTTPAPPKTSSSRPDAPSKPPSKSSHPAP
jgi:hypothetical protein